MPLPPTPPPPRRPSRPIRRVPAPAGEGAGPERKGGVTVYLTTPISGPAPSLEDFEIVRSLGRGSRGEVLEVRRLSDGSRFALKRSLRPLSGPAQRRHWLRECHAQLRAGPAPGLLPLLAAWEQRRHFLLLLPLCPAGSLGSQWRRGGGTKLQRGVARLWRGVASPLRGVAWLLWGLVRWVVGKRGGDLGYGGVASASGAVTSHTVGVASSSEGVASPPMGVMSSSGGVASSAGGVVSVFRGVASFLRGVASAERVMSPPGGVASLTPPDASSPLVHLLKGGVANSSHPSSLAEPPEVGVADPKDPSPLSNQIQGGVACTQMGVAKPWAVSGPSPAISDPLTTPDPLTMSGHSPATSKPWSVSEPSPATPDPLAPTDRWPRSEPAVGHPVSEWRLRGYLWDVLGALRTLHGRTLTHGDIKPDNVLLDGSGRCRLADFGVTTGPGVTTEPMADFGVTTGPGVTTEPMADFGVTTGPGVTTGVTTEPMAEFGVTTGPGGDSRVTPAHGVTTGVTTAPKVTTAPGAPPPPTVTPPPGLGAGPWGGGGGGGGAGGGDPRYAPPEAGPLWRGGEGRPPGDIFSLALSVAEMAGEWTLPGAGEGWRRLRCGGGAGGRMPPGLGEGLSPEFRAVLAAMLEPNPHLRPSAQELLGLELLRGAGRWRPLTRLADVALREIEDWLEAVPGFCSSLRRRFRGWVWGPQTPPRPPRADPWSLREEEEEEEGPAQEGEGSRSPSPTPDPRRTLTFDDDDDPEPLPPPP